MQKFHTDMSCHNLDLGSDSDWLKQISLVLLRYEYGISTFLPETSFGGKMLAVFSG